MANTKASASFWRGQQVSKYDPLVSAGLYQGSSTEPLQLNTTGYLLVALTETKDGTIGPQGLKALLSEYEVHGIAVHVWDEEKQDWVRLTLKMIG
jgi:hypothetical protein